MDLPEALQAARFGGLVLPSIGPGMPFQHL